MIPSVTQAIAQLAIIKSRDTRFKFPCPICWFGNLDTDKPIILTIGINPSDKEFLSDKNGKIYFRGMEDIPVSASSLIAAYNGYFDGVNAKPYSEWFNTAERYINAAVSRLYNKKASFYTSNLNPGDYQLLHVDLFPFATKPTWSGIKKSFNLSRLFSLYGKDLLYEIIDYLQTKAGRHIDRVIVFGRDISDVLIKGQYVDSLVDLEFVPSKCNSRRSIKKGILQLKSNTNKTYKIKIAMSSMSIPYAVPAYAGLPGKALAEHMDELLRDVL